MRRPLRRRGVRRPLRRRGCGGAGSHARRGRGSSPPRRVACPLHGHPLRMRSAVPDVCPAPSWGLLVVHAARCGVTSSGGDRSPPRPPRALAVSARRCLGASAAGRFPSRLRPATPVPSPSGPGSSPPAANVASPGTARARAGRWAVFCGRCSLQPRRRWPPVRPPVGAARAEEAPAPRPCSTFLPGNGPAPRPAPQEAVGSPRAPARGPAGRGRRPSDSAPSGRAGSCRKPLGDARRLQARARLGRLREAIDACFCPSVSLSLPLSAEDRKHRRQAAPVGLCSPAPCPRLVPRLRGLGVGLSFCAGGASWLLRAWSPRRPGSWDEGTCVPPPAELRAMSLRARLRRARKTNALHPCTPASGPWFGSPFSTCAVASPRGRQGSQAQGGWGGAQGREEAPWLPRRAVAGPLGEARAPVPAP